MDGRMGVAEQMTDMEVKLMNLLEIAIRMRAEQVEYFKTRSHEVLKRSKRKEKEFDQACANLLQEITNEVV
jgi:phosphate uptake regulator